MKARALLALTVLAAAPAAAETVDEVVSHYLAARGGLERIRSVTSLRMTGAIVPAPAQCHATLP